MDGTVLVADDDRTIRTVLTQALTRAGCRVHATSSLTTLMRWVAEGRGDAVITDVVMPDGNGLEMLPKIAQDRPGLPVIVISAQNTIMTAIKAAEAEAFDYLPKPFDLPDLMKRTARALQGRTRQARPEIVPERPEDMPLIGQTPAMQAVYRVVAKVVNAEAPLLITGESGTGKSLLARAIHDLSDRREQPFVVATPEDMEGMEGPARLLSRARGGTLVLDALGDMDAAAQGRAVRMLDAPGDPGPRVITLGLPGMEGVRDDLRYRLSGAVIALPPLRERVEDIPLLVAHFRQKAARDGETPRPLSEGALALLRAHPWPGNVRQLENTLRRLELGGQGGDISREEVAALLGAPTAPATGAHGLREGETLAQAVARHLQRYFDLHGQMLPPAGLHAHVLREIETPLIEIALDATGGNQAKCADLLGINRNTLRKKITDLDIRVTRRRKLM